MTKNLLMSSDDLNNALINISQSLLSDIKDFNNICFVGIRTRGIAVAKRILSELKKNDINDIPLGTLDITLYRDDFRSKDTWPVLEKSDISFDVNDKEIVIVDDVIYTGRTARAAMEAIMDYGRPSSIKLITLIDRGYRELPIQPDFHGVKIEVEPGKRVNVFLEDIDGKDGVELTTG